jgi:dihydrofolate reductase
VASATLVEPLDWQPSAVLRGEVAEAVRELKQQDSGDRLVVGSTMLVQALIGHGLADELQVMLDPLLVGGGKRIFPDDGGRWPLRLLDSQATTTGAILAPYVPARAELGARGS